MVTQITQYSWPSNHNCKISIQSSLYARSSWNDSFLIPAYINKNKFTKPPYNKKQITHLHKTSAKMSFEAYLEAAKVCP
jgi:hypothetical protein